MPKNNDYIKLFMTDHDLNIGDEFIVCPKSKEFEEQTGNTYLINKNTDGGYEFVNIFNNTDPFTYVFIRLLSGDLKIKKTQ